MKRCPSNGFVTTPTAPFSFTHGIQSMAVSRSVSGRTAAQRRRPPDSFQASAIQRFHALQSARSTSGRCDTSRIQSVLWSIWMSTPSRSMCPRRSEMSSRERASSAVTRSRPARSDIAFSSRSTGDAGRSPAMRPSITQ